MINSLNIKFLVVMAFAGVIFLVGCGDKTPQGANETKTAVEKTALITEAEVNQAQQSWCNALVKIGEINAAGGDAKAFANEVLTKAYAYDTEKVFFKPTLAFGKKYF